MNGESKESIIREFRRVNNYQQEDGFWYEGKPTKREKINGAMKIFTAIDLVDKWRSIKIKVEPTNAKKIIDNALNFSNDKDACDNFNITYVLCKASRHIKDYRSREIDEYLENKLDEYKEFYYPKEGGFSFNKRKTGTRYYGAKVSRGLDEPDIHGTAMFIWGIACISEFFNIKSIREFIP